MQNGEDYEPGCGDKVLILAYGPETDPCSISNEISSVLNIRLIAIHKTLLKTPGHFLFTDGHPTPNLSKKFSWIGWARYVKYLK